MKKQKQPGDEVDDTITFEIIINGRPLVGNDETSQPGESGGFDSRRH